MMATFPHRSHEELKQSRTDISREPSWRCGTAEGHHEIAQFSGEIRHNVCTWSHVDVRNLLC